MERVTISSSLKFKDHIQYTIDTLQANGVVAVFPNLNSGIPKEEITLTFLQQLEQDHFNEIDKSEGLYVICPEGYVGTLVSVEIGYAKAKNKKVIFSEVPSDLGLQALADGYVSLSQLNEIKNI